MRSYQSIVVGVVVAFAPLFLLLTYWEPFHANPTRAAQGLQGTEVYATYVPPCLVTPSMAHGRRCES